MEYQNYDPTAYTGYTGYAGAPYIPPDIPAWSDSDGSENPTGSTRYWGHMSKIFAATDESDEDDNADDDVSYGSDLFSTTTFHENTFHEKNQYTFPSRGKRDKHPFLRRDYNLPLLKKGP
ncbi:hypothetical protein ACEPPN_004017 [Leptodophora sp. 'Broadleaf-Isolate-01']